MTGRQLRLMVASAVSPKQFAWLEGLHMLPNKNRSLALSVGWIISGMLYVTNQVWADARLNDLSDIWALAKENIHPKELSDRFSPEIYDELHALLREHSDMSVADAINPFLDSLGISHTHLYDEHELEYYMLRSMFTTGDIDQPTVVHIGAQTSSHDDGLLIEAVLHGSPAHEANIKRGDILTRVNGEKPLKDSAFFSYEGAPVDVVRQTGANETVTVVPVKQSMHTAFSEATRESVQTIERDGLSFGYIHLWSGTHQQFLDTLQNAVFVTFANVDGIILDLRDGYGGAWWPYLDPFFADTTEYFVAEMIDRDGTSTEMKPESKAHRDYYTGPLAVLTNNGVRSGKEALAYQFKKSGRATLVGTKTAGAFVGGLGGFANEDRGFILYLSVFGMHLDGERIEGHGITPHIEVSSSDGERDDLQFEEAVEAVIQFLAR